VLRPRPPVLGVSEKCHKGLKGCKAWLLQTSPGVVGFAGNTAEGRAAMDIHDAGHGLCGAQDGGVLEHLFPRLAGAGEGVHGDLAQVSRGDQVPERLGRFLLVERVLVNELA